MQPKLALMNLILTFQVRVRDVVAEMHRDHDAWHEAREAACKKERDDRLAAFKLNWPDHESLVLRTQNRSPRNLNLQKLYSPGRLLFHDRVLYGLEAFHDDGCEEGV